MIPKYKKQGYVIPLFQVGGTAFTNMPANDGVEIISNSGSDVNKITIFGTTYGTGALAYETVTMLGASQKATTKVDWDNILGVFLGDIYGKNSTVAVGTITVREASGNATIITLTAGVRSAGSQVFLLPGRDVIMHFITGNTYKNANHELIYPTVSNSWKNGAGDVKLEAIREYLYLLGDASGSTVQIEVTEDTIA
jgi:hypothetical protein